MERTYRIRHVLTGAVAAAAVLTTTAPASAAYDTVPQASHRIVGYTAKNFQTHVWTSIIGTYSYDRIIRRHGHRHRVTFRGIKVSAQRCKLDGCWGPAKEARLWSPLQHGRAPGTSRSGGPQAGAVGNFCLSPSGTFCAAPWNWNINDPVSKGLRAMAVHVANPCAAGALAGFGVKVTEKAAAQIAAESGLLAAGERAAGIFGPEGLAVGSMAGCFVGIGAHGWANAKSIASALNPFDRTPRRNHAQP